MKLPALRPVVALLLTGLAVDTLVACGPSSSTASPAGGAGTGTGGGGSGTGGSGGAGAGGGARFPGVTGLIVALSGTTMQVRTTNGQTAVSYGSKTSVTEQRKASAANATAGMCAVVRGTNSAATPSGARLTAMSVSLSSPTNGSCTGGFGGFGGGPRPGGARSGAASARPGGVPSGADSASPNGRRFGVGPNGKIVSVSKSSMVIEQTRPATSTANSVTVTLTDQTTYTKQAKVGTQAIAKGKCVLAVGKTDSTGAMTANALRLSPPLNGSCSVGFGGRGSGAPSGARTGG